MEDKQKDGDWEEANDESWDGHNFKIPDKTHIKYGGKVDIRRVSDLQKHGECIACHELHDKVRQRFELAFFGQMDDERSEGKDDDVVRSEDGGHRYEKI